METVRQMIDRFCDQHGIERSVDCENVVDNGAKSASSILSKVKREVYSGNIDFHLSKVNDLSRCAIITEDYHSMISLLINLQREFNNLNGHISRQTTGYIGIHLSFTIDNIPVEVQLSTKDAWLVKQASEHIYKRHRDFEAEIPFRLKMIKDTKDLSVRQKLIDDYKEKLQNYKKDYADLNLLFQDLHSVTDLYENLEVIEGILLSCQLKQQKAIVGAYDYDKILNERLTDNNGAVNDSLVLSNSNLIKPVTDTVQSCLVTKVSKVIASFKQDDKVPEVVKKVISLRNIILSLYTNAADSLKNGISLEYKNLLNKTVNIATIKLGQILSLEDENSSFSLDRVQLLLDENGLSPERFGDKVNGEIQRLKEREIE